MTRLDYFKVKPDFITKMRHLTREEENFKLDGKLRALVELRVSQTNGCDYCMELHTREALALGEKDQRLVDLPNWQDSPLFDDREKAALGWAETITLIPKTNHADENEYLSLLSLFSETEVVELSLAISLANFWNRMAGAFRKTH